MKKVNDLRELKNVMLDLYNYSLRSVLDNLTNKINEILEHMFDNPIEIQILTLKEIKSRKFKKSQINIVLNYNGVNNYGLRSLSGGEMDRLSFAITLGFNLLNNSPILLLDECLSSVDSNLRYKWLKAIRNINIDNKYVICIGHDDIMGYYDDIVEIF